MEEFNMEKELRLLVAEDDWEEDDQDQEDEDEDW